MINQFQINGEYIFNIKFQNMFIDYDFHLKNHNLITTKGLEFFVKKWINENDEEYIKYICIGSTNSATVSESDEDLDNMTISPIEISCNRENNQLILSKTGLSGRDLNNTNEIGVKTSNNILISRDIHETLNIPDSCILSLRYIFTLKSYTDENDEECVEE